MSHKSYSQLQDMLDVATHQVKIGARYAHYKHPDQPYSVTGLAIIEATEEVGVIYRAEYGDRVTFVRPLSSWLDQIENDGQTIPRFAIITPQ